MPGVTQCPLLRSQSEHVAGDKILSPTAAWQCLVFAVHVAVYRVSYQGRLELCLGLKPPKRTQVEPLQECGVSAMQSCLHLSENKMSATSIPGALWGQDVCGLQR